MLNSNISKSVSINTMMYSINAVAIGIISFVLISFLTNNLPPEQYGKIELFTVYVGLFSGIVLIGGPTIISGEYFKSKKKALSLMENHLLIIFSFVLLACTINYIIPYSEIYSLPKYLVYFLIISAGCVSINTLNSTVFILDSRPLSHGIFNISLQLFALFLSIIVIQNITHDYSGRIIGILASNIVYALISMVILFKNNVRVSYSKLSMNYIAKYGLPLVLIHINGWINEVIDKVMITEYIGIGDTGIYSVGYKFGMITMLIGVAVGRSVTPIIYRNLSSSSKERDLNLVHVISYAAAILFALSIILIIVSPVLIIKLTHPSYHRAIMIVPLITLTYFIDGLWKLFVGILVYYKQNNQYLIIMTLSAFVNVLLNYILLSKYGIIGAAWASLASFSVGAIYTMWAAHRLHPLPWASILKRGNLNG